MRNEVQNLGWWVCPQQTVEFLLEGFQRPGVLHVCVGEVGGRANEHPSHSAI